MKYESEYISAPTHDANQESPRIKNQEKLKTFLLLFIILSAMFPLFRC